MIISSWSTWNRFNVVKSPPLRLSQMFRFCYTGELSPRRWRSSSKTVDVHERVRHWSGIVTVSVRNLEHITHSINHKCKVMTVHSVDGHDSARSSHSASTFIFVFYQSCNIYKSALSRTYILFK